MFRFAAPYALLLLVLPAGTALLARWRRAPRRRPAIAMSGVPPAHILGSGWGLRAARVAALLPTLALVLLVAALARPQWGIYRQPVHLQGIDILLALDLSESMGALDFQHEGRIIDRLEAVKGVVRDFVRQRAGDRIGMVVFGSRAYTQMPLTHDHNALTGVLDHLWVGAAGRTTAMGDAIGIALKRLADARGQSRVIVLLTDGASNSGLLDPLTAADIAARRGVRIHAVGVGSPGRAAFAVEDPIFGSRMVYRSADLDEATLQAVADRTGGRYFRAGDRETLAGIFASLDALEKSDDTWYRFTTHRDLYPQLLVCALGLLAGWVGLRVTRVAPIP